MTSEMASLSFKTAKEKSFNNLELLMCESAFMNRLLCHTPRMRGIYFLD